MKILVLDCKEYAIKFSLVKLDNDSAEFPIRGMIESIGMAGAIIQIRSSNHPPRQESDNLLSHKAAIQRILKILEQEGAIQSPAEIDAVAHRVVHGGESFQTSTLIDDTVIAQIRSLRPLAPLHNPAEMEGILAAMELLPRHPHVANFDTAFYATLPDYAYLYGLPFELYKQLGIRRYGFHGLSHRYLMDRTAKLLDRSVEDVRLISCHLGSGCSITAIDGGHVKDTSMGFTPTEGLVMESRCGDIDPGLILFLKSKERLTEGEMLNLLNKFSGLKGLSGSSGQMKSVLEDAEQKDKRAQVAIDVFCYRVRKYIASYLGVLGGADALVFSAGIGTNSPLIRARCVQGLDFLGIKLDKKRNEGAIGKEALISSKSSEVQIFVIPDNEEYTMASRSWEVVVQAQATMGDAED